MKLRLCFLFLFWLICSACNDTNTITTIETVSTPTANPPGGEYNNSQIVMLNTTTIDASIYFTLDGSNPTVNNSKYTDPILVEMGQTLKAYAVKTGWNDSGILTAIYTQRGTVSRPVANPESGTFISGQTITLNTITQGATIYYTIDGSDPSLNSNKYINPIELTSNTTIKAIAIKEGMNDSIIIDEIYTIKHIYIAGAFNDGADGYWNTSRDVACFWKDGQKTDLTEIGYAAYARAIAVNNNHVYIAGDLADNAFEWRIACYWVDGKINILSAPLTASVTATDILLYKGHVYVTGHYWDVPLQRYFSCYWIDGQRIDLPFTGKDSKTTSITISNNVVYISGHDSISQGSYTYYQACYWVNGEKINLPFTGTSSIANSITVFDNNVYIAGYYNDGNSNTIACYWVNGEKVDLSVQGTSTSNISATANVIVVKDGDIYIAGRYIYQLDKWLCYWVNNQRIDLSHGVYGEISDFTLFNNKVYVLCNGSSFTELINYYIY